MLHSFRDGRSTQAIVFTNLHYPGLQLSTWIWTFRGIQNSHFHIICGEVEKYVFCNKS